MTHSQAFSLKAGAQKKRVAQPPPAVGKPHLLWSESTQSTKSTPSTPPASQIHLVTAPACPVCMGVKHGDSKILPAGRRESLDGAGRGKSSVGSVELNLSHVKDTIANAPDISPCELRYLRFVFIHQMYLFSVFHIMESVTYKASSDISR